VAETEGGLVARRTWRADEDFYRGHYPGAPITPGVLLCEAVFQAGALFLARARARAGVGGEKPESLPLLARISDVRFRKPVFPGETITIEVKKEEELGGFVMMSGTVKKSGQRVLTVNFSVACREPDYRAAKG
jgi:3-hydroxyacyl-[acyl-carrier-protein] dehydratase